MSVSTRHDLSFDQAIEGYLRSHGQLSFLQIGGSDGAGVDALPPHIAGGNLTGVIVEPVPMHFERLQALHAGSDRIKVENCAIALPDQTSPVEGNGVSHRSLYQSYEAVIAKHGLQRIDLLQIHAGRHACELLKAFDVQRHRPVIVRYTCRDLAPEDRAAAEQLLVSHGYVLNSNDHDTLALHGVIQLVDREALQVLTEVANQLLNEQNFAQALPLYDQVLRADPGSILVAVNSAKAASHLGHHADALRRLRPFASSFQPGNPAARYVGDIINRAAVAYNEKGQASELQGAAEIIDGLIVLDPEKYLSFGLAVADALQRTDVVADYASRLMRIRPQEWYPHFAYSRAARARGDTAAWLHHAAQAILMRPWTRTEQDVSLSSNVYFLVTDILDHPECPQALRHVNALRAKVNEIAQDFDDEQSRRIDRFMRVSLDALDVSVLDSPLTEEAPPQPALTFADAQGAVLTAEEWRQRIQATAPHITFLAAADEVYLRRYGRNYVRSLLERCDVGCAVVLGLIGEPERLSAVIEAIGIADPRLFYFVDRFDPAYAVSYYSTRECRTGCANAYYQSVRFLVLEYLLAALQLPIMVSDIDLHLQGSVAGLLECHAGKDIVLNRHLSGKSYGSRFTANLTLFRPGRAARHFARILRLFLQQALQRQHIEQFIDQTAFALAHYHCLRHGLGEIDHFLEFEINNVMLNRSNMGPAVAELAGRYVFLAYYGSQGDSAVTVMQTFGGETG